MEKEDIEQPLLQEEEEEKEERGKPLWFYVFGMVICDLLILSFPFIIMGYEPTAELLLLMIPYLWLPFPHKLQTLRWAVTSIGGLYFFTLRPPHRTDVDEYWHWVESAYFTFMVVLVEWLTIALIHHPSIAWV